MANLNEIRTPEAMESGPHPRKGGTAEGDEERLGQRAGPESKLQGVQLSGQWMVLKGVVKRGQPPCSWLGG